MNGSLSGWPLRSVIGAALVVAAPALPADGPTDAGWFADGGWFLEANVANVESSGRQSAFMLDGDEQGWTLAGGYAFNRYLALQGGLHSLGAHFASDCAAPVCTAVPHDEQMDIKGVSVAVIGTWRVAPAVELFGKVGVLGWDADFEIAGGGESDRGALYGAGVGIWVTPRWRLNVQYDRADFDLESTGVGVSYRF